MRLQGVEIENPNTFLIDDQPLQYWHREKDELKSNLEDWKVAWKSHKKRVELFKDSNANEGRSGEENDKN